MPLTESVLQLAPAVTESAEQPLYGLSPHRLGVTVVSHDAPALVHAAPEVQQGWPMLPQAEDRWQKLSVPQTSLVEVQGESPEEAVQHAWPVPPQLFT